MPLAARKERKKPEQRKPTTRKWENNLPMPTELEIEEGRAWLAWSKNPLNEEANDRRRQAFNALMMGQAGDVACVRCSHCLTLKWGRLRTQPCGVCGMTDDGKLPVDNRAIPGKGEAGE